MSTAGSPEPLRADAPVWRIVEEVLGQVLARPALRQVVEEALEASDRSCVPTTVAEVGRFVDGALFGALAMRLELDVALEVAAQLRAALAVALAREADPPRSGLRGPARHPSAPRRVISVSRASLVLFLLQEVLGEEVDVVPAVDAHALESALAASSEPALVLVDRKYPCIGEALPALLAAALPQGSAVLLWGAEPAERGAFAGALGPTIRLETEERDTPLPDLAARCQRLVVEVG